MIPFQPDFGLPYMTAELPGIGGSIRATPDNFVVEEIPLYDAVGEGQHLYVNLTKVELTTKEVQKRLAQEFGISERDVGFAGMKDKHARTTQTFSLNVGHRAQSYLTEAQERLETLPQISINWVNFHGNKLKVGHLLGNRFEITISDLDCPAEQASERSSAVVGRLNESGLPNFFGPQRFGRDGDNVVKGHEILKGRRRQKDRWLRKFLISSYQSYLCNRYLARRVDSGAFDHLLAGDIAKKVDTGGIFDVEDVTVEQARYAAREISFTAPLYGFKMRAAKEVAGQLETDILAESDVEVDDFRRLRIEGTRRLGRLFVDELAVSAVDNGLTVRFSLPKGAYATTVLREFMKVDLVQTPEIER